MNSNGQDDIKREVFLSIVSHELKTPITSIQGFTQALQRKVDQKLKTYVDNPLFSKDELQKHQLHLEMINKQVKRLTRLIDDLLDVSVIERGSLSFNWVTVDLIELMHDILARMQITLPHKLLFQYPELRKFCVVADESRLEKLFSNLINNASKYSPLSDKVLINAYETGASYIISVKDFGDGIAQEDREHIFELYYRGKQDDKKSSGLGLGLYLSKQIADMHNGKIYFDSDVGNGTTFYIELPKMSDN